MESRELIEYIGSAEKKTPVKIYVREISPVDYGDARVFGCGDKVVFGDWEALRSIIESNRDRISDYIVESSCRNSALPMLDIRDIPARIEPGAVIREKAEIGANSVIMMGAVINIGAVVGEGSMIDMNAVLGGRAVVGRNCHIGAGAVIAGSIEPASALPVVVGDDVLVGANAVVLEGVRIGKGAVIAAGAVVTEDVPANMVAAGCPARIIKEKDASTVMKTGMEADLRML